MSIIGITGKSGTGKSLLSKKLKSEDTFIIDIDKISRAFFIEHHDTIEQTIYYLQNRHNTLIENSQAFWDLLMATRKEEDSLSDPLWQGIESKTTELIKSSTSSNIVLDYALLPKTNLFSLCDYTVLLLPYNDSLRKQAVIRRDNLQDTKRLDRRDKFSIDYQRYKFDKIFINTYDEPSISSLAKSILEELELSALEKDDSSQEK